jgi:hypothetical protein
METYKFTLTVSTLKETSNATENLCHDQILHHPPNTKMILDCNRNEDNRSKETLLRKVYSFPKVGNYSSLEEEKYLNGK